MNKFQIEMSKIAVALFTALILSGCGGPPSESDGRKFFEAYGEVQSFKKTNGLGDEKNYTIEYEVTLKCSKKNASPPDPRVIADLDEGFSVKCYSPGQIIKKEGRLAFEKTENGWRVNPGRSN